MVRPEEQIRFFLYRDSRPSVGKASPVQKGIVPSMYDGEADLCEEGIGFGTPILQYKREFYFPGSSRVSVEGPVRQPNAEKQFILNLIERHERYDGKGLSSLSWIYQRLFNRVYKTHPGRLLLQLGSVVGPNRRRGMEEKISRFFRVKSVGAVITKYELESVGRLSVKLDLSAINRSGLQHIYVSNELGGGLFTEYFDSSGVRLSSSEISGWDRINGDWAAFYAPSQDWGFRVEIPSSVVGFRGRETMWKNVSWSGVIHQLPADSRKLEYQVTFGNRKQIQRGGNG